MLFALQNEFGYYVGENSTLSGSYVTIHFTMNIKYARLWKENDNLIKGAQTRINRIEAKQQMLISMNALKNSRLADGFQAYDIDIDRKTPVTQVQIVELELLKKEKKNG